MKNIIRFIPKYLISIFFIILFCANAAPALARQNVTDWYIKNFDSTIIVNKDSTLDITEKITADCGSAVGKHGIFRIIPEDVKIEGQSIATPVELISITDFSGNQIKFKESRDRLDKTVTWKIGDPNKTVQGVNNYLIHYQVKNAVRFYDSSFDELYWNLTGNFWDLEIDKFHAKIIFPKEVTSNTVVVEYYTGYINQKRKDLAVYHWSSPNVLKFNSTKTLAKKQGITTSVTFPKNIFTPYVPSFSEKYGGFFYFLIPLVVFFVCFSLWRKYGDDPKMNKAIIPEYEPPANLSPIEVGLLRANGKFNNKFITAEIVYLATRGIIKIKETSKKILFFNNKDYEFERTGNTEAEEVLNKTQKEILENIFSDKKTIQLSSLKKTFYKKIKNIKKSAEGLLKNKKLIVPTGLHLGVVFRAISILGLGALFSLLPFGFIPGASIALSIACIFLFSFIMPKRTITGAELNWKIKGFKYFIVTEFQ